MKNALLSLVVLALLAIVPVRAAEQPGMNQNPMAARTAVHQEAMKKLEFLAGTWKGKAWYSMGPNRKHEVEQTETVQIKQQGVVLLVEGLGRDASSGAIVHDAMGVLSYDDVSKTYRLTSWAGAGRSGVFDASVGSNRLEWGMKNESGTIRYTLVINEKGEWFEIGERSSDGATWIKFCEMTLQKVQ